MALPAGTQLGPYQILAPIGAGGMGEVYQARDTRLERDVAIKVLPDAFASDTARDRFQREARAASALSHPNICAVYDVGESEGRPFLVMELLDGQNLRDRIAREAGSAGRVTFAYECRLSLMRYLSHPAFPCAVQ